MTWKVRYSYLPQQFENPEPIFDEIKKLLRKGDFTLGSYVDRFEEAFAKLIGAKWAVGVGSGTDAIMLSLKAAGVQPGDEVITAANTFIATAGAINAIGAKPVFVDVTSDYTINPILIEKAITKKTKAIVPVHLTGQPCNMNAIMEIAKKNQLLIIEDACQSISAAIAGKTVGTFGLTGCFSLHPLKNLNVWGDGGIIVTNDAGTRDRLRLLRNHGLKNRDEVAILGFNSRLDSLQAIVGLWLMNQVDSITAKRIQNSEIYDKAFSSLSDEIAIPERLNQVKHVFHLYQIQVKHRDQLFNHLLENKIEAKIHYPIPLYLQEGFKQLGYQAGDFPETDRQAAHVLTLPVDQHLTKDEIDYAICSVQDFIVQKKESRSFSSK